MADPYCYAGISSFGMEIVSGTPVADYIRIGYVEQCNGNRRCLRSHVTQFKDAGFTHIHWAFANLTADFRPDVSSLQEEFDVFKGMTGIKKIVSFRRLGLQHRGGHVAHPQKRRAAG
jgi:hypothetical protein